MNGCCCPSGGPGCAACRSLRALRLFLQQDDVVSHVQRLVTAAEQRTQAQQRLAQAQQRALVAAQHKAAAIAQSTRAERLATDADALLKDAAELLYGTRREAAARLRDSRPALELLCKHFGSRVARPTALLRKLELFCRLRAQHERELAQLLSITAACRTKQDAHAALTAAAAGTATEEQGNKAGDDEEEQEPEHEQQGHTAGDGDDDGALM